MLRNLVIRLSSGLGQEVPHARMRLVVGGAGHMVFVFIIKLTLILVKDLLKLRKHIMKNMNKLAFLRLVN